ncbi:MAG: hypothetical protein QF464_22725, partial [Myxococcota bacterium]|nr:hypothetical protein [Myxococcota bacterium]
MLPTVVAVLLSQTGPQITVRDVTACVEASAFEGVLLEALPSPWREDADTLSLSVEVLKGRDGQPTTLTYSLSVASTPVPLISRQMPIIPADCPSLPKLIAVVVGRHLADLPREAWTMPGGASEPTPPPQEGGEEEEAPSGSLALRSGLEAGLDAPLWGGLFGVDGAVSWPGGFGLRFGVEVLVFGPLSIVDGAAQLTTLVGRFGPTLALPVGSLTLELAVGLGAGVSIA